MFSIEPSRQITNLTSTVSSRLIRQARGWVEHRKMCILIASYTEYQSPEFSSFREEWGHYHPKTEVAEPEVGIAVDAVRTAHEVGIEVERATTQHTIAARRNAKSGVMKMVRSPDSASLHPGYFAC
jgi:hypothetical protein